MRLFALVSLTLILIYVLIFPAGETNYPFRPLTVMIIPPLKFARKSLFGFVNSKTQKGEKLGVLTGILYLAPSTVSGFDVCPHASKGCASACLYTAGRGRFNFVQVARIRKTLEFFQNRTAFIDQLKKDIVKAKRKAKKEGKKLAIRLNGTSDLKFELYRGSNGKTILFDFPDVQFYDYTKNPAKAIRFALGKLPANYHVTFSRSEDNDSQVDSVIEKGGNVAVVFSGKLPATYKGKKVVNGDLSDVRFYDEKNVIVGLKAKGEAKKDKSGFVVSC